MGLIVLFFVIVDYYVENRWVANRAQASDGVPKEGLLASVIVAFALEWWFSSAGLFSLSALFSFVGVGLAVLGKALQIPATHHCASFPPSPPLSNKLGWLISRVSQFSRNTTTVWRTLGRRLFRYAAVVRLCRAKGRFSFNRAMDLLLFEDHPQGDTEKF